MTRATYRPGQLDCNVRLVGDDSRKGNLRTLDSEVKVECGRTMAACVTSAFLGEICRRINGQNRSWSNDGF